MSVSTPLKLYNTLSREREGFVPLDPEQVRLYVCGPTVYDFAHIGNARPLIVFDVLYRLLREKYGPSHVKYVRNITDVDDKINARAAERAITIRELTEETNRVFQEDVAALNCLPPDVQPRATEHIAEMIAIIEKLIANGHAYAADGHVLFDVPSMPEYGALSRRPLDDMIAGARVDVAPYKKGEMDFVLWKPSKENEPGWDSPWGRGRPGWHIECSAMSHKHLGEVFDIHGGGIDLVFPHHENEIAQTRCAFGHDVMANVWMHNGFLQVEGEKMSKSLGNFVTIHELLHSDKFGGKAWKGEVLRLAMMRSHYRQPIDWTVKALEEAEKTLSRWYAILRAQGVNSDTAFDAPLRQAFVEALCDDLNIPRAMAELHAMAAKAEPREGDSQTARAEAEKLLRAANLLGLLQDDPAVWEQKAPEIAVDVGEVEKLVSERLAARKSRNFAESDRLRDLLADMGVKLKDGKDKTTGEPTTEWEVAG
ncbi:cysteine--tRNA ligase [Rhodoblastus sp.]|jgi:cysteinyl-tRNA synthetase|uniref:cysteine--tRNA ligase n=1 Tax=Rhodoblastus sp. TaxID=1962975 RepID=UPI0025FF5E1D|nr:cysteine--tRNA ligase [Rhodoblastus sp.]